MVTSENDPWLSLCGRWMLALVLIVAASIRFYALDRVPYGLWFDEALNAQDAVKAANGGGLKLIYPDEFPREPMYETILIGVTRVFGPSVVAYRTTSAVIGILTIFLLFVCVRSYMGEREALLAAAVLATLRWHVIFSRLIFRTLMLPMWITLIVLAAKWVKQNPTYHRAAALGALVGGGFYIYLAWYFMLPGVLLLLVWVFWDAIRTVELRRPALFCGVTAMIVASPLFAHYRQNPADLFARPDAVSPLKGENPLEEIGKNFFQALGMFHYRGDHVAKQNIPHAPALNRVEGIFFAVGIMAALIELLRIARRHGANKIPDVFAVIILGWVSLGICATIFSKTDSPNFLRTLVVTPAVATLTSIGFWAVWTGWTKWTGLSNSGVHRFSLFVIPLWLALGGGWTSWQVFYQWANRTDVFEGFVGPYAQLGNAAAETPPDISFWVPRYIAEHRTFQFISSPDPRKPSPKIIPYANFDFLRSKEGETEPRRIVATAHNVILPVLESLAPKGKVIEFFRSPEGNRWAALYEVAPGDLPSQDKVAQAERNHPEDIRW